MGSLCFRSFHDFKADEQWGAIPSIDDRFDQFGEYNPRVVNQHLSYFPQHDGHQLEDVIDKCIFVNQSSSALVLMKLKLKRLMLITSQTHLI
jgi:hypothetical protein